MFRVALAVSPNVDACRRMNMLWGVIPVRVKICLSDDQVGLARQLVKDYDLAKDGASILLVQGFHKDNTLNHPSVMALKIKPSICDGIKSLKWCASV